MFPIFFKHFYLICVLLVNSIPENESPTCERPKANKLTHQKFTYNTKNFERAPQLTTLSQCPENFIDAVNICYNITSPSAFPPKCPFENVLPFTYYINIISTNGTPIWMPVRRDTSNGLGHLVWREASTLYMTEFSDYQIPGKIKGNDCLVYYNSTKTDLVSCDEKFSGVCAYYKLNELSNQMCHRFEPCYQKDFNANANCVCLGGSDKNQSNYIKVEFLKPYQTNVYQSLTQDDCTIGLEKTSVGTYIWTNSQKEPDYSYWRSDVDFGNIYGALTPTGWILTAEPLPCFLYEKKLVPVPKPSLKLSFEDDMYLFLTINNINSLKWLKILTTTIVPLVYCFCDAGDLSLIYPYEYNSLTIVNQTDDTIVYRFDPYKKGPGNYWCEAFAYLESEPIKSERLFVNQTNRYGDDYVAILNISYIPGSNPFSDGLLNVGLLFFFKIEEHNKELGYSYGSRIMKIIDIDEENFIITVNVHFTYLVPQNRDAHLLMSLFTDQEYNRMKTLISEIALALPHLNAKVLDFRSASYCPEDFGNIYWPRTNLGEMAISDDYCFKSNGMRLQHRTCEGNFIDGAYWSKVGNCTKPSYSSITQVLLNISRDPDQLTDLCNISSHYSEFNSFDVYLLAQLLNTFKDRIDISELVNSLENIFKIDDEILAEAQEKMRTTDIILETIDEISTRDNNSVSDLNSENFFIIFGVDSTGIVLLKNGTIQTLTGDCNASDVIKLYPDLESAVWIISRPKRQYKTIFKLFNNNAFFIEPSVQKRSVHTVFGITISSTASIQFLYKKDLNINGGDCVYWTYNLYSPDGRGSWKNANDSQDLGLFILCDYADIDVAAVTLLVSNKIGQNITEELENLLQSDENPGSILIKLSNFSNRYDEFTSHDVYLVGRILEKISDDSDLDLSALAHVVSNIHEIQRNILSSSQKEKMATDMILHAVDTILNNHHFTSTVNVTENNFMIYAVDVKETDFTSLVVFESSQKLRTGNMTGNIELENLFDVENLNSALYLPPGLKQQLMDSTRIIVTIFFNDGLFNEDVNFKYISKIFGIILSLDDFLQPLSIIHRVTEKTFEKNCVYWSYDKSKNTTGLWKKDHDGNTVSVFGQCEFWHTTHFALLLVDTNRYNSFLLDWITNINCFLSMFGLCSIVMTAVLFKRWRTNRGNQILLNYVFASILQICVFYTSSVINQNSKDHFLCTIFGVVLHYSIISQFCWMFVIAVLQFQRFVYVLRGPPKNILLKACLCGWGLPCLPIVCVYFLDPDNYIKGNVSLCYPSGLGLFLGVWLPIGIVVVINFVIFIFIIYNVVHKKTECSDVGKSEGMFQWRLAILLFFMLGITWTFGFLSEFNFGIVFVYVFCITATLQGFVMFMFFIVFNSNTRYLYVHACNKTNKYY